MYRKFQKFIQSLKTPNNQTLIESIEKGFNVLFEETIDVSKIETIIKAGTPLYHGTPESFDIRKITTGAYDDILWTTSNTKVAKYYIPAVGGYRMNVDLERNITSPFINKEEPWYSIVTNQLGINESMRNHLIEKANKIKEENFKWYQKTKEYQKLHNELEKKWDKSDDENIYQEMKKIINKWQEAEDEYEKQPYIDHSHFLKKAIAYRMKKLFGYESNKYGAYSKIIIEDDKLKPIDYQIEGKLVTLKPKRDLKLYNYAYGRSEGDLTDVDYHKHEIFQLAKNEGYDGIIIHDFAQSEKWGNVGHISYGIFPHAIKDLDISSKQRQKHPVNESTLTPVQEKDMPIASNSIDGLTIRKNIPNTSSIESSFSNYKILPKIRELSLEEWEAEPHKMFGGSVTDIEKVKYLVKKIQQSGEINPLIIEWDKEGELYVVEGTHRLSALYMLGKKTFPALVVKNLD